MFKKLVSLLSLAQATSGSSVAQSDLIPCKMVMGLDQCNQRIITIGDVHGSLSGMLSVLHAANATVSPTSCEWRDDATNTLIVQVGDIVDRGPQALEAWQCLDKLQKEALSDPQNSNNKNNGVIRLIGNHDLWWLEGHFHHRNVTADTYDNVKAIVDSMRESILDGRVMASYVHHINNQPILFIHAGLRAAFLSYLKNKQQVDISQPEQIASFVNALLRKRVQQCPANSYNCELNDETFQAGSDRGGKSIGGPFWTDFGVLVKESKQPSFVTNMIQVVGHTMAYCYNPRRLGEDPPIEAAECSDGLIRAANNLAAVCVDGGMYVGGRAYLEISCDGHFRSYQIFPSREEYWTVVDLTAQVCGNVI